MSARQSASTKAMGPGDTGLLPAPSKENLTPHPFSLENMPTLLLLGVLTPFRHHHCLVPCQELRRILFHTQGLGFRGVNVPPP